MSFDLHSSIRNAGESDVVGEMVGCPDGVGSKVVGNLCGLGFGINEGLRVGNEVVVSLVGFGFGSVDCMGLEPEKGNSDGGGDGENVRRMDGGGLGLCTAWVSRW